MLACLSMLVVFTLALSLVGKVIPKSYGFIIFALIGIPVAGGAFIFPPAMLSEISSKITEKTGNKIEGICFGIQGFFLKMAFMVSILLLPFILVFGSATNSVNKNGIYMTAIFAVISFVISIFFYYKYEE